MSGINRIAQTPKTPATVNKFNPGDRVKIADSLGNHMAHFPFGKLATVKYTYAQSYGSKDDRSMQQYCLDVDGIGVVSWYDEQQLSAVTNDPIPISF